MIEETLQMEIIVNNKVRGAGILWYFRINGLSFEALDKGINVIQLETASGAAIQSFEGAQGRSNAQCECIL